MWQYKKRVQRENAADKQTGQISGQKDSMIQTKNTAAQKRNTLHKTQQTLNITILRGNVISAV